MDEAVLIAPAKPEQSGTKTMGGKPMEVYQMPIIIMLAVPSIIVSYLVFLKEKMFSFSGFILIIFVFTITNMNVLFWYKGINLLLHESESPERSRRDEAVSIVPKGHKTEQKPRALARGNLLMSKKEGILRFNGIYYTLLAVILSGAILVWILR